MVAQRVQGLYSIHCVCQLLLAAGLFWGILYLIHVAYAADVSLVLDRYTLYCACVVIGLILEDISDLRRDSLPRHTFALTHKKTTRQLLFAMGGLFFFLVLAKDKSVSRTFLLVYFAGLYGLLFLSNHFLPAWLARLIFRGPREERTLLLGSSQKAALLQAWLSQKQNFGLRPVGLLTDEPPSAQLPGLPVLGGLEELERIIRELAVAQVIVLEFPRTGKTLNWVMGICEKLGARLLLLSDFAEKIGHPITFVEDDGLQFIGLRIEPLENPLNRALKRLLDLALALPVVLGILPLTTLLVWCLQHGQSRGPLFHVQSRAGRLSRPFTIIKYRTMHAHAGNEARQATPADERVYPAGHWLRRFSIDELPQFWNVLKGEMSVVGPRPHLLQHDQQFTQALSNYRVRAFVKPGITGLAQVSGYRGETASEGALACRVRLDIHYLEHWSIGLDCWIILQTIYQVLVPPKTAY